MAWTRRGEAESLLYDTFLDMLIVVLIAVLLFGAVHVVQDNTLHQERVAVRDFALVRDAGLAAPGQVVAPFVVKKGFTLDVDTACKVVAGKDLHEDVPKAIFFCGTTDDQRLQVQEVTTDAQQQYEVRYVPG